MSHGLKVDQKVKLEPIGDVGTVVDWDEAIGYLNSLKGDKVALSVGGRYVVVDESWVAALPPEPSKVYYTSQYWIDPNAHIWKWDSESEMYLCLSKPGGSTVKRFGWSELVYEDKEGL